MSPFSVVPIEAFTDKRLTLEQLRVLGVLYSFKNKESNTVFPSRDAIAERCGMHKANISMATSGLEKLGWVSKEGKGGHSRATRYTLHIPETVAQSATVAGQTTVAQSATGGVADQATRLPVAESATRKEQSSEQTTYGQFDDFWNQYPKKVSKAEAEKAWRKLKPKGQLLVDLMAGLDRQKVSRDWQKENGQFIPHPATWLNKRRWEDEITNAGAPSNSLFVGASVGNLSGMDYAKGLS